MDELVPESALPAEANLHDALTKYPQLLPAADLGLGRTTVVGRETGLASGRADLVLLDEQGQLCIVEVKKEGNPDTRRVVAQLLDYAADLWGKTVEEFETSVVLPHLRRDPHAPNSLSELVDRQFGGEESGLELHGSLTSTLTETLNNGTFVLVVAAPEIPPGVRRVLDYLNAQGFRLYGIEVSYFTGSAEAFVPRIVVSPPPQTPKLQGAGFDRDAFLLAVPASAKAFTSSVIDGVTERGVEVRWTSYGASLDARVGRGTRQIAWLEPAAIGFSLTAPSGFPPGAFEDVGEALDSLGLGQRTPSGSTYKVEYSALDALTEEAVRSVLLQLCERIARPVEYVPLDAPLVVAFERNDSNIWEKAVQSLRPYHGKYLKGTLSTRDRDAEVELQPLAGDQPGWVPRFTDPAVRTEVWPHGARSGSYELRVLETSR
jgi:hypothetical protein